MNKNNIAFLIGVVLLIGLLGSSGCATKKYVLQEVAALDQKVEGVEGSVEENQKRIKEQDERLTTLGSLITQQETDLKQHRSETDSRINEVKKYAQGNLVFEEMLKNDEAKFKFDSFELTTEAKVKLDEFVTALVALDRGVYLEIQGHTDNTGPDSWNLLLSKKRAEAVKDYLHRKYRIPLHRMEVIGYGSDTPIADNATRSGRVQNRRVVILVYE